MEVLAHVGYIFPRTHGGSIYPVTCFPQQKGSPFFFRIYCIVLRFNSDIHVFGDIIGTVSIAVPRMLLLVLLAAEFQRRNYLNNGGIWDPMPTTAQHTDNGPVFSAVIQMRKCTYQRTIMSGCIHGKNSLYGG